MSGWTATRPTARQLWVHEQAKKAFENTVPGLNDYLGRLLTLTTALAGGSFLAAKEELVPRPFAVAVVSVTLFAVAVSAWGLMPIRSGMWSPFHNADEFEHFEKRVIRRKLACAWASAGAMIIALLVAVAGLAVGGK